MQRLSGRGASAVSFSECLRWSFVRLLPSRLAGVGLAQSDLSKLRTRRRVPSGVLAKPPGRRPLWACHMATSGRARLPTHAHDGTCLLAGPATTTTPWGTRADLLRGAGAPGVRRRGVAARSICQLLPPFRFIGLNSKISPTKVDDEWWKTFCSLQKHLINALVFLNKLCLSMHKLQCMHA